VGSPPPLAKLLSVEKRRIAFAKMPQPHPCLDSAKRLIILLWGGGARGGTPPAALATRLAALFAAMSDPP